MHLALSIKCTSFLNERGDDVRVPHHSGSVHGCLVTLRENNTSVKPCSYSNQFSNLVLDKTDF